MDLLRGSVRGPAEDAAPVSVSVPISSQGLTVRTAACHLSPSGLASGATSGAATPMSACGSTLPGEAASFFTDNHCRCTPQASP